MTNPPRKLPSLHYNPEALDAKQPAEVEAYILNELSQGPIVSFGGNRPIDRALKRLRNALKIKYVKVKDGGNGWQLT